MFEMFEMFEMFGNVRMEERGLLLLLEARLGWPLTLSNFLELQLCKYLHLTVLSPRRTAGSSSLRPSVVPSVTGGAV